MGADFNRVVQGRPHEKVRWERRFVWWFKTGSSGGGGLGQWVSNTACLCPFPELQSSSTLVGVASFFGMFSFFIPNPKFQGITKASRFEK